MLRSNRPILVGRTRRHRVRKPTDDRDALQRVRLSHLEADVLPNSGAP
jgi:hypothetical protein